MTEKHKVTGSHILLRHRDIPDIGKFDAYVKQGGFETFPNWLEMEVRG